MTSGLVKMAKDGKTTDNGQARGGHWHQHHGVPLVPWSGRMPFCCRVQYLAHENAELAVGMGGACDEPFPGIQKVMLFGARLAIIIGIDGIGGVGICYNVARHNNNATLKNIFVNTREGILSKAFILSNPNIL
jgi:hypothetical protein